MNEVVRIIKKYPNRRLYDTATSSYITLTDVKRLVLDHVDFRVIDAKSSEDLTRSILLQIILEEESGGVPMFSSAMLSQMIRFYGNAMQGMMGNFLEKNIQTFIEMQQRLQAQSRALYGGNPILAGEAWTQFLTMQSPAIQGLMARYLEQSANAFVEMQDQLHTQTRSLFAAFQFPAFGTESPAQRESTGGVSRNEKAEQEQLPADETRTEDLASKHKKNSV